MSAQERNRMITRALQDTTAAMAKLLVAVLLTVPAGFAAKQDKNHQDAFVGDNSSDSQIVKSVRHQLVMLPYYGVFDDLAFRLDGNTVTLLGAVTNPVTKTDAERSVKKVEGVGQVVNQIEVLPLSPMDGQIRRAMYQAIYGDPALSDRYGFRAVPSIHILVKNGHVNLEGVVANQMDKELIGIRAKSVPGVFSVDNNLQVEQGGA
jgi:hyperosmotically inducible periplasmic protein